VKKISETLIDVFLLKKDPSTPALAEKHFHRKMVRVKERESKRERERERG